MSELEIRIEAVTEFVKAYERHKYNAFINGGELPSVACFMVDYCQYLRNQRADNEKLYDV